MGDINPALPQVGKANLTEEPKIVTDFDAIATLANGGLDAGNFVNAFTKGDLEPAFTQWKTITRGCGEMSSSEPAADYIVYAGPSYAPGTSWVAKGTAGTAQSAFYLDPADWPAGSRTKQVRLRCVLFTAATSTGSLTQITMALRSVTAFGAASNTDPSVSTVNATPAVSAVFTGIGASAKLEVDATAAAPAAGFYVITATPNAALPAGAEVTVMAQLLRNAV